MWIFFFSNIGPLLGLFENEAVRPNIIVAVYFFVENDVDFYLGRNFASVQGIAHGSSSLFASRSMLVGWNSMVIEEFARVLEYLWAGVLLGFEVFLSWGEYSGVVYFGVCLCKNQRIVFKVFGLLWGMSRSNFVGWRFWFW